MKYLILFLTVILITINIGASQKHNSIKIVESEKRNPTQVKIHTIDSIRYISNKEDVKRTAIYYAHKYKINEDAFICTLFNEAGFDSKRIDGSYKCGDSGASCGLSQFQCPTWKSVRSHMGKNTDCTLRHDDFENLETAAYGMANGWKWHWTGFQYCYKFMNLDI